MKKLSIYIVLLMALPAFLQAQYMGGNGNGNATIGLTNVPLSVHRIAVELPAKYELYQNYPNPFNPVTKIKFDVPLSKGQRASGKVGIQGVVSLKVFDITGKEIAVLVNEKLQPGTYEVTFDGKNLPSGIYFYKLETENIKETKKMLMVK